MRCKAVCAGVNGVKTNHGPPQLLGYLHPWSAIHLACRIDRYNNSKNSASDLYDQKIETGPSILKNNGFH